MKSVNKIGINKCIRLRYSNNNNKILGINKCGLRYNNKRFYSTHKPHTKSLKERLISGLKVGWNIFILPEKVANLYNHPFVRIFRVIGGILIITVLSKKHLLLFTPFKFIILFFAMLHYIYIYNLHQYD